MNPSAHKDAASRAEQAAELLRECTLCHRKCRVNRLDGQKGYCRLEATSRCFREMIHNGEESELIPSHQVYFAGCNLRCEFCSVAEWNEQPEAAEPVKYEQLQRTIKLRRKRGAKTLNLLGGEPTVSLPGVLRLLSRLDADTRVVLNSNMFYSDQTDDLLTGLVDVYLADFKCGNSDCAADLLDAGEYVPVVKNNILRAAAKADLIVRHTILPGHGKCCVEPLLRWLADKLPQAKVSLRTDYIPPAEAQFAPAGYPQPGDMTEAEELARRFNLNLIK